MPSSAVLDTALGLVLFFFTVAVVCSAAVESIANLFRKRAKYLLRGMHDLLDGPQPAMSADPGPSEGPMSALTSASARVYAATKQERALYSAALAAGSPAASSAAAAQGPADGSGPPTGPPSAAALPGAPGPDVPTGAVLADAVPASAAPAPAPATAAPGTVAAVPDGTGVGPDWTTRIMAHPLVAPFKQSRPLGPATRNPSYLPAPAFAAALLDEILGDDGVPTGIDTVRRAVTRLPDSVVFKPALVSLLHTAGDDLHRFMTALEGWYDSKMDQIGGAYGRWAKRWLIVVGIAVALVLQLDAIAIGRSLYTTPAQRAVVVAAAGDGTLCPAGQPFDATQHCVSGQLDRLGAAGLPFGWSHGTLPQDPGGWLLKILGLAVTAIAASLGAPFWFDVLNRLASLRNTGRPPQSSTT